MDSLVRGLVVAQVCVLAVALAACAAAAADTASEASADRVANTVSKFNDQNETAPSPERDAIGRSPVVAQGEAAPADAGAGEGPGVGEIEVIEVVGEARQTLEAAQLLQRQDAAVVSDTISAELIKKSTDSDAAEIVQRLPAVTIADNRFLVVRGLGERYSSALLNGSRLPSTDPDKRVVSLDLFPAGFISSLNVIKSFTPDLPGDFSGGLVDVQLENAPEELTYSLGVSTSFNTQTTFDDFDTYDGANQDYIGFGADFRDLPGRFGDKVLDPRVPSRAQQGEFAGSLKNIWDVDTLEAPPNLGLDFSIGNTFGPLGLGFATTYDNEFKFRPREKTGGFANGEEGGPFPESPALFFYDRSRFETNLGAVAIAGLEITPDHTVQARGFVNRNTFDEVLTGEGTDPFAEPGRVFLPTQLKYRDDQLGFGQFGGQHGVGPVDIDWRTAISQTVRREPDTRQYQYQAESQGAARLLALGGAATPRRLFFDLDEELSDSAIDFTLPFLTRLPATDVWSGLEASFKAGVGYLTRNRNQTFRRFEYDLDSPSFLDRSLSPEIVLNPSFVGIPGGVSFREASLAEDEFEAKQDIAGVYGMFDLPIIEERLRFVGGVRVEYSYIDIEGFERGQTAPITAIINDLDPLPGLNLIYSPIEDMNVRIGYSQTVSRPEFRELTPTEFPVPGGTRTVIGNPDLTSASIDSYDLRWEWFLNGPNLVSASFFYKDLTNPIEKVARPQTSGLADTFINVDAATVWGFEFEGRHDFGPLSPWVNRVPYVERISDEMHNLSMAANASVVESDVEIPMDIPLTTFKRPLQGQPEFVVNASIEYSSDRVGTLRMLYNTIGRQIASVGADKVPDIYAERRDQLDFVWSRKFSPFGQDISAKFTVENILNDQVLETQESFTSLRYVSGVKIGIGFSYTY